ncbi:hypothetical protein FOF52_02600 [Thermobifida alba]|uniref:Amidotransferase n=1 Tax=Thermobifida alba TaxID=53522 RepID=A0ABY4L1S6_THEAE|nr:hypothetical protein [Thermobifida alba]UPT19997.1 hypothetical protein FOF52_02600 [Thermobifida alba]HLU97873.1 hypothetical protein [Thermobifida alba]
MSTTVLGVLLIGLGGLLFGGTLSLWKTNKAIAVGLAACAVLALAAGVLRLGYF